MRVQFIAAFPEPWLGVHGYLAQCLHLTRRFYMENMYSSQGGGGMESEGAVFSPTRHTLYLQLSHPSIYVRAIVNGARGSVAQEAVDARRSLTIDCH